MTAVHDTVEDSVGQRGIVEVGVPMFNRQLTGDQRCFAGGTVVEHFQQIGAFGLADRRQAPIVEDQEVDAGELLQAPAEAAIAVGDAQFFEQPAEAGVGRQSLDDMRLGPAHRRARSCRGRWRR